MKQKNSVKQGLKLDNYTLKHDGIEYKYTIQEPQFEQLSAALSVGVNTAGAMNMTGAGKVIFETCCTEYDEELTRNARLLINVCIDLFNIYVLPVDVEIKKN